jgi:hypothetical protein
MLWGGERLLYSNAGWGSLFLIYARGLIEKGKALAILLFSPLF